MLKRSLLITILAVCVIDAAGISGADILRPEIFRRSDPAEPASAVFALSTYANLDYGGYALLEIMPKTSGKYSYTLIDTRNNNVLQTGGDSFTEADFSKRRGIGVRLAIVLPDPGESIKYMVTASYVPDDNDKRETASFSESFTIRNTGMKFIVE